MTWLFVAIIVGATIAADLLQSVEMKRHGEIRDLHPRTALALARRWPLLLAVFFMAVSFFTFLTLLSVADLTFAVPATAATYVFETILARCYLKELVTWKRWAGAALVAGGVAMLAL
jgi:drug/metabolite transporter (DMT)-like permease